MDRHVGLSVSWCVFVSVCMHPVAVRVEWLGVEGNVWHGLIWQLQVIRAPVPVHDQSYVVHSYASPTYVYLSWRPSMACLVPRVGGFCSIILVAAMVVKGNSTVGIWKQKQVSGRSSNFLLLFHFNRFYFCVTNPCILCILFLCMSYLQVYVIEVSWSEGTTTTVYRRYSTFYEFQVSDC